MDSPPKLTGETLIVHHIPLVHCQVPDRKRCSMGKRPNPFYHTDLGITRTTSLPERDLLQKETLLYSSLIQASCLPPGVPHETEGRLPDSKETNTSDQHNSLIFNENNDQEISYNSSFHPQNSNINNSPFVLHEQPFHLHGAEKSTKQWSSNIRQGIIEGQEEQTHKCDCKKSNRIITSKQASADLIELPMCNCAHDSTSTLFFDCNQGLENTQDGLFGKQDLLDSRKCSCSSSDIQQSRSCVFSDQSEVDNQHMTYNSDSSCNSSDGVLVNFTAIYNKMKTQSKSNLSSGNMSHDSSYCSHSEMGAFYLDLQSSPSEPKNSCDIHSGDSAMQTCLCHQQCSPAVDDNCNSYHLPCENMPCSSENSDYTACFQSQARLVVATQNYYKLVTCDLSSQSTPSPAGSSITSCSEDHAKSTSPSQPTEYYLFRQPEDKIDIDQCFQEEPALEATEDLIEGQVYVNVASNTSGRQRSRSYDRNLDKGPSPRLGSLERMYSCPGKLSDSHTGTSQRSPPRRVTSFAEIARTRKRSGNSPPLKTSGDSSIEFSPILENQKENNVFVSLDEECCHNLPGGSSPKMDLTTSCAAPFIHRFSNKNSNASLHDRAHLEGYGPCYNGEDGSKLEPVNPLHQQVEKNASFDSSTKMEGQSVKQLQSYYSDFFPDYFSLAEKPPAEFCLSPDGTTESISVDLLQKKGLVKAVNTAVDLIVAHFGTSRDPGVKAKLGNSTVSPNVGHLILKYLCPAMKNVLQDGLKAYIPDMIIGQRKNLPWIVIEASTQLGPSTKALNNLFCKISQCSELTSRSTRFNAFIFGLLNIRSLEFWFNHLYNHEDIIGVHYLPTGFLALSHSVCQSLFEELLLLLQPLSLLPFDLDLMFEYHVIQMNMEQQKKKEQLKVKQDLLQSVHSTFQLMRNNGSNVSLGPIQDREDKSEGFTLKGVIARDAVILDKHEDDVQNVEKIRKENVSETKKDKQAGWWYQLMQSSQVYIEGSSEQSMFVNWEKRKKQSTATVLPQLSINTEKKSLREGVPEGAESQPTSELHKLNICGVLSNQAESSEEAAATKEFSKTIQPEYSKNEAKPSWMGSPPESVLHELKNSKVNESTASNNNDPQPGKMPNMDNTESKQGMWLGRLFGASVNQARKEETRLVKSQKNRLPSGWLGLDRSVYDLMVQTMGAGKWRGLQRISEQFNPQSGGSQPESQERKAQHEREVKALCHHIATEKGQLSFKKGDVLRVISKVDADWLLCGLGAERGLVPFTYVTHPEDEDY
ncbi:AP-4 complex accessory subunit RUSC2-like isoform X4 [Rhincodon typus]|uniref:AP-4 complex accessory subunit RUSC2-like isoform X4 n=1 Tax=Rhincodon typus TaxID=259920 RepID=UPI00202FDAB0|nr:AP-4 complex accessory subunit RUSC2-like isoform X4 [Rhincodon typus]